MRYYEISVANAQTGELVRQSDGYPFNILTTLQGGASNPGALNIEFDLPVTSFHQPVGQGFLRIWGVGITAVGQPSQFNPALDRGTWNQISIYGGMAKGLPLANPKQNGLLVRGMIQQAFSNWEGTDQTLDFVIGGNSITYGYGTPGQPKNIVLNWQKGQSLSDAAGISLAAAFPGSDILSAVRQDIVPSEVQPGFFESVDQFSLYLNETSRTIINDPMGAYRGYSIAPTQSGFRLFDGTVLPSDTTQISFLDLIGKPSWLNPAQIAFKTVLRADIAIGDLVQMPLTPTAQNPQSFSQYRARSNFKGAFLITAVRHMGRFRERSGTAWVTAFEAAVI